MMQFEGRKVNYLLVSLALVVVDQWSKWLVEQRLADQGPFVVVPGFLNFVYVKNTGVAFGMLAGHGDGDGWLTLSVLGMAALALVGYLFLQTLVGDRLMLTSLALIMGGAVGNLIDRVANGAVTDFIDVYFRSYHWYTFNVADSAITIGICLMILHMLLHRTEPDAASQSPDN